MNRRALTLIELLVVLVIISMVTAAAIPMMAPQGDSRRQREAARSVASFLQGARSRAMEAGRPVAVIFEWFPPGQPTFQQFSMNLAYGQSGPPYGGEMANAVANRAAAPPTFDDTEFSIAFDVEIAAAGINPNLVRAGDLIRFNYQGVYWRIDGPDQDGSGGLDPPSGASTTQTVKLKTYFSASEYAMRKTLVPAIQNLPFQVFRQPTRSFTSPLQLPEGAVVDVTLCGQGSAAIGVDRWAMITAGTRPADFVITFAPDGSVDLSNYLADPDGPATRVDGYYPADGPQSAAMVGRLTAPVFLMIGKREKVVPTINATSNVSAQFKTDVATLTPAALAQKYNFRDSDNFWVVVNPSGTIVTGEIATSNPANGTADDDFLECLNQSRKIARTGEGVGGR